jgi:preprotein translocase subunit Sec63
MRRIKRTAIVLIGWAAMGWMVYLILVTQRIVPKLWNPYDILGIVEVGKAPYADGYHRLADSTAVGH